MNKDELITEKYVFFWNGIYSQWYRSDFTIADMTFNCCEQYMMYKKAMLFGDEEIADQIMEATHPSEQKSLGRLVKNFNRDKWDEHCFSIVYRANYAKFNQSETLKNQLLLTGDRTIVEASPYDKIWGVKMYMDDEYILNPAHWKGLNLLGFSLMTVRNELKTI